MENLKQDVESFNPLYLFELTIWQGELLGKEVTTQLFENEIKYNADIPEYNIETFKQIFFDIINFHYSLCPYTTEKWTELNALCFYKWFNQNQKHKLNLQQLALLDFQYTKMKYLYLKEKDNDISLEYLNNKINILIETRLSPITHECKLLYSLAKEGE